MKIHFAHWFTGTLGLLLLPYLCTIALFGTRTALMVRSFDPELILPMITSEQIKAGYEKEAIKAQTVIARTNLYRQLGEEKNRWEVLFRNERPDFFQLISILKSLKKYQEAAGETKDQVLTWQGELRLIPYCEMSNGQTRSGAEAFHDENYGYLVSVDSSVDKKAPDYLTGVFMSAYLLPEKLEIVDKDSRGYVKSVLADEKLLEAEAFRQGMGLISSDFSIYRVGNRYRFLCKGKGHGLGFSQYGGNETAKEGADYMEILNTYFPRMELEDIQRVFEEK